MAFDPDAYLAAAPAATFNPDAYLAQSNTGIPGQRKKPTMGELALASPPARLLMGAAAPLVGAVQLGANVGDYINEKMGQKPVVSKAIADWWNNLQATKERGMAFGEAPGVKPVDVLGGVGTLMTAAAQPSNAVTTGKQIIEGMKQGAVVGTALPGTTKLSDQAVGGVAGTVLGGAAPFAIPAAAKALGWMWDTAGGRLIQVKAGKILREAAGDDVAAIMAANAKAAPGLSSGQAVQEANVLSPVWQALNQRAPTANIASAKAVKEAAEQAGRVETLQAVTPNLATSIAERSTLTSPLYTQANEAAAKISPELQTVFERLPKGTLEKAADLARMDGRPFILGETKPAQEVASSIVSATGQPFVSTAPATTATISGESLHYIKRALSDIANASPSTGIGKDTQSIARNVLTDYLKAVESKDVLPIYGQARKAFAEASKPVNQAQVLNKMVETIKGSGTATEKPAQFLNALGQGESALLKRADQNPRFGGLSEVLTPEQMAAANKVAGELKREATMAQLAKDGSEALSGILKERAVTAPGVNATSAIINKVSGILRGRVSDKTMEALAKGMQSGQGANELLATLPAVERNAVLKALAESNVTGAEAGAAVNAMAPRRKNQNAMNK